MLVKRLVVALCLAATPALAGGGPVAPQPHRLARQKLTIKVIRDIKDRGAPSGHAENDQAANYRSAEAQLNAHAELLKTATPGATRFTVKINKVSHRDEFGGMTPNRYMATEVKAKIEVFGE